jgi:hypothetical protein
MSFKGEYGSHRQLYHFTAQRVCTVIFKTCLGNSENLFAKIFL